LTGTEKYGIIDIVVYTIYQLYHCLIQYHILEQKARGWHVCRGRHPEATRKGCLPFPHECSMYIILTDRFIVGGVEPFEIEEDV
jgi:hypothetical protein